MKVFIGIIVAAVVIIGGVFLLSPKAPENVGQAVISDRTETGTTTSDGTLENRPIISLTSFGFVGYGPGKSHTGSFGTYDVANLRASEEGVPTSGSLTIYVDSITTDNETLTKHLKEKKEFFNSATYPTINFALSTITDKGAGTFEAAGNLTVKGVTKAIAFPVQAKEDKTFTSEFRVDMTQFGFGAPGVVDNEVLIKFAGSIL